MRALLPAEVSERSLETLGFDAERVELTSVEVIAGALRRSAGLLCPCSGTTLVRAVLEPLRGLYEGIAADGEDDPRALVEETLEALVAHGDLLELHDATHESSGRTLLFAAPPSFIRRSSGTVMILGVAPDGMSPIPEEIERCVEHVHHVRIVARDDAADLADQLAELGLVELSLRTWTKAPKEETPAEHLARMRDQLAGAPPSGDIPGLRLLDAARPVRDYRRRWVEPSHQTGRFVGRRPQAYGADLWCYVETDEGAPLRLVDFPIHSGFARGCDEAWRLQAAIDYEREDPQVFRVRPGPDGSRRMDLFSPVPKWARRRWDAIGEPVPASGCSFSYRFSEREIVEESAFAREHVWLAETS